MGQMEKNMNLQNEFRKYAMSDWNVSSSNMDYYQKQIDASMTPYILEEREMRMTQMDIFSRLMADRLLWVAGPVNDNMSTVVQAQLMFLDISSIGLNLFRLNYFLHHFFHIPTSITEISSQPVKQLRMRRHLALATQIDDIGR